MILPQMRWSERIWRMRWIVKQELREGARQALLAHHINERSHRAGFQERPAVGGALVRDLCQCAGGPERNLPIWAGWTGQNAQHRLSPSGKLDGQESMKPSSTGREEMLCHLS